MDPFDIYKFHPVTGNKLVRKENKFIDSKSKLPLYINPKPTVTGIITYQNRILLVKRGVEPRKDTYDLPGGFIEANESFEEALFREIHEELNIKINIDSYTYFKSYTDRYEFGGINHYTITPVFICAIQSEQTDSLSPNDDVSSFEWFDPKDLPSNPNGFPSINRCLNDYANSL